MEGRCGKPGQQTYKNMCGSAVCVCLYVCECLRMYVFRRPEGTSRFPGGDNTTTHQFLGLGLNSGVCFGSLISAWPGAP